MKEIIKTVTADFARRGSARLIFARQDDSNTRRINIILTDGGKVYYVPQNCVAIVNILRPDGKSAAYSAEINEDGSVSFLLGVWALEVVGEVKCSVSIFEGDEKKLTSADFLLDVETSLYSGDDISNDSNYSLLVDLMSDIADIEAVEEARVTAEEKRASAESSRSVAEADRENAEKGRVESEKERDNNEEMRKDAETYRVEAEKTRNVNEEERKTAEIARFEAEAAREQTILKQNARIEQVFGLAGEVVVSSAQWVDNKYALKISELYDEDAVMITPATENDKDILEKSGLYVIPEVTGGIVNMTVDTAPEADIKLLYFITRGGFIDGDSNAVGNG